MGSLLVLAVWSCHRGRSQHGLGLVDLALEAKFQLVLEIVGVQYRFQLELK
jgi:hypothetical protein